MIAKVLLGLFFREILQESAKKIVKEQTTRQLSDSVRVEFLRAVTEGYTKELTHNIGQYVRSLGAVTVEVSSDNAGERLLSALQTSLRALEIELESQGPESPVIQYLQRRYGEESGTLVGRESQPVYSMISGYDTRSSPDQPWLNRVLEESPEVTEILAEEAARVFDLVFPEVL